jgi:hypothetical protein
MSKEEAAKFGIEGEDRSRYFRVERAKANSSRRGTLYWVELVERPIPNGEAGAYGDTVTVCRTWRPPSATTKVTDAMAAAIRDEIGKSEWRRERRAGNSWAGNLVGRRLGLNMEKPAGRTQAEEALAYLIREGWLATEFRATDQRHTREYVIPGKSGLL